MTDTHGFGTVIQATESVIEKILRAAWKSAECPDEPGDEGRIPEYIDVPPPAVTLGTYTVADGQVQIPQDELGASLAEDVGVDLEFGLDIQFEIEDPPVPSARLFNMHSTVTAQVPIDTGPDNRQVFVVLGDTQRADVAATVTTGHPLDGMLDQLIQEYVHAAYENRGPGSNPALPSIPHEIERFDHDWEFEFLGIGVAGVVVDVFGELYDDPADPARRITINRPDAATVEIGLPVYLRIYNIRPYGAASFFDIRSPMGLETRVTLSVPFASPPGQYIVDVGAATVTVGAITAGPDPSEAGNYVHNRNVIDSIPLIGTTLDEVVHDALLAEGEAVALAFGSRTIEVPTLAEIEDAIADIFHGELAARGAMPVWTPPDSPEFAINDVTVRARSDVLVIGVNAGPGAAIANITSFVPADREFAIALDGDTTREQIAQGRVDAGLADGDMPVRMEADGKDVDLHSLDVDLVDGSIRTSGDVTVIDAVLGSIDVDASFVAHIGLHWEPNAALNADGVQELKHHEIGEPDVDTDLGWLASLILGLIGLATGGFLAALIGVIIGLVISAVASSVGASIASDAVSGLPIGVGAWPSELARIGSVQAVFHDPVVIEADGITVAGTMEVVSSCESAAIVAADSGSSYSAAAASPLTLQAANTHPAADYGWEPGDGTALAAVQDLDHVYLASGIYLARHRVNVTHPGGATSRHFALVDIRNVPPTADAGPDIVVDEGEVVTLVGHFSDVEFSDTHETVWIFGDDQRPEHGVVAETNTPPRAIGTSTVQHAWCDNGVFTVTFRVRDQNGGIATDTRTVEVRNVPPVVDAGPDRFAYPCMPITLCAGFEDAGWCDTHTGTWDFGDCTPVEAAVIEEEHEPPAAVGTSCTKHIYRTCGSYRAVATVIDDDGGVGTSETTVRVVEIGNAGFEDGFYPVPTGLVANQWRGYVRSAAGSTGTPGANERSHDCEQCVVHSGRRAQRLHANPGMVVGIWHRLGANPGWCYQVSTFYALAVGSSGIARLGIDPTGGSDPTADEIVWTDGGPVTDWGHLTALVTAEDDGITIFLEAASGGGERGSAGGHSDAFFDDVAFVAVEPTCCPSEKPDEEEERPEERCVRFERRPAAPTYEVDGFVFRHLNGQPVSAVTFGPPPGAVKLGLSPGGLEAVLPFPADAVSSAVAYAGGAVPEMAAFDSSNNLVGQVVGTNDQNALQSLVVTGSDITRVVLAAQEGGLFEFCIREDTEAARGRRALGGAREV